MRLKGGPLMSSAEGIRLLLLLPRKLRLSHTAWECFSSNALDDAPRASAENIRGIRKVDRLVSSE